MEIIRKTNLSSSQKSAIFASPLVRGGQEAVR